MSMSIAVNPRFLVDETGAKTDVLLTYQEFKKLMEELEDLDDRNAYDEAVQHPDFMSWEEAKKELDV